MNYPYNVPSVTQIPPAFTNNPNILNVQAFQGVHASKTMIGTPVDPLAGIDTEGTVEVLSASKSEHVPIYPCPELMYCLGTLPSMITDPIIETAKNCVHLFKTSNIHHIADASLDFGLQPGVGVFVQQQFINFGRGLARMDARNTNTHILSCNQHYISDPLCPLQKYVSFPPLCRQPDPSLISTD